MVATTGASIPTVPTDQVSTLVEIAREAGGMAILLGAIIFTAMLLLIWPKVLKPWLEMRLQMKQAEKANEEARYQSISGIREMQRDMAVGMKQVDGIRQSMDVSMQSVNTGVKAASELLKEVREVLVDLRHYRDTHGEERAARERN